MKTQALKVEPFPVPNYGGFCYEKGNIGQIELFLPPVKDTTVELNVPGLPRKAVVDSGDLKFVLVRHGTLQPDLIEMQVITVGKDGEKLIAPFTYANVHTNGEVCWGRDSDFPRSLAAAWTHYWTAPFNTDLAALPSPMSYSQWLESRGYTASMDGVPRRFYGMRDRQMARMSKVLLEDAPNYHGFGFNVIDYSIGSLPNDGIRALWNLGHYGKGVSEIPEKINRIRLIMQKIKSKVTGRGKKFVAVNNRWYMKLHSTIANLELAQRQLADKWYMSEDCPYYQPTRLFLNTLVTYVRSSSRSMAQAMYRRYSGQIQDRPMTGGTLTNCFIPAASSYEWDGAGIHKQQHRRLMDRASAITRIIGVSVKKLAALVHHVMWKETWRQFEALTLNSHQAEYNEWREKESTLFFKRHYLENGWVRSLEFDAYEPLPAYYQPCDGIVFVPSVLAFKMPPISGERITVESNGKEVDLQVTRWCFYSKLDRGLRKLFHPDVPSYYITNGLRSVELLNGVEPTEATLNDLVSNPGVLDLEGLTKEEKSNVIVDGQWFVPRVAPTPRARPIRRQVAWPPAMRPTADWDVRDTVRSAMGPISGNGWVPTRRSATPPDGGSEFQDAQMRAWRATPVDDSGFEGGANERAEDIRPWYEQWVVTHEDYKCYCYHCVFRANRYEFLNEIEVPGYFLDGTTPRHTALQGQSRANNESLLIRNNPDIPLRARTEYERDMRLRYVNNHIGRAHL